MDRSSILIWLGLLLSFIGTLLSFNWNTIYDFVVAKELCLSPGSKMFAGWEKSPMPITMEFSFFNWTNPEGLFDEGYKPNFIEVGPYIFRESIEIKNITWNANYTVTYHRVRTWIFDEEKSNGTIDDQVTTLDPVPLTAAYISRFRPKLIQYTFSSALKITGQKIASTDSVGEILFHGVYNPLLTMALALPALSQAKVPGYKFAWYYNRNNSLTHEGLFNVNTGADDITKLGHINWWNYSNRTEVFESDCGRVNGTIENLYPPKLARGKSIVMFTPELCRSITLDYAREQDVRGTTGYRYEGGPYLLDNGTIDPNNWCNCGGECVHQGVLNISKCRYGSPGFASYPHFLHADPLYREQVVGMQPDPEKHTFYVVLEPRTGVLLAASVRFQFNILLQPSNTISLYYKVPRIMIPLLWFDEKIMLSQELVDEVNLFVTLEPLGLYVSIGILLLGLIVLAVIIVPRILRRRQWDLSLRFKEKPSDKTSSQRVKFSKEGFLSLLTTKEPVASSSEQNTLRDTNITDASVK